MGAVPKGEFDACCAAARAAERKYPHFEERLVTLSERMEQTPNDPFLHLLADDTLRVAADAAPEGVAGTGLIFGLSTAALAAA